ncbi:MAG: hypothetical protein RMX57_03755 [Planktomarina sp.]|nr:hypothetical protein [Planktomarina sp.]
MATSQSLLEQIAAAQVTAKALEDRISEALKLMDGSLGTDAQVKELRRATKALELAAVDIFSIFEARMQHHFKRGPFSRKLKALLLESKQPDLADRLHKYYLAVNVLKHGKGASYRELLNSPTSLFDVKSPQATNSEEAQPTAGLIDVTVLGFFDGLTKTIVDAYHFLEDK